MLAFFPFIETLLKRTFWYRQRLLFRFFFYLDDRSKMRLLGFGFIVIAIQPGLVASYDLFEQIFIVVERRQHLLSDVLATLF